MLPDAPLSGFTLKVASRCNLNCSYCYVYNKGDSSWRGRPAHMSEPVFAATLERIAETCRANGRDHVSITFHGGEPTLVGPARMDRWCEQARETLDGVATVRLVIQTNATRLTPRWTELFRRHEMDVGISMDGPREIHDAERVDHRGRGSYDAVRRGIDLLHDAGVPFAILSVVNFDADPLDVHGHFLSLEPSDISYLMPDFTHATIGDVRRRYGPRPCHDFLAPILEEWWHHGTLHTGVQPFTSMARMVLGGRSDVDAFGTQPLGFVFVETDGTIEGLDVLRVCGDGAARTSFNVLNDSFADFASDDGSHAEVIFRGRRAPQECEGCPEHATCAGGYLPHRWSPEHGFARRSVWCADILGLLTRLRELLDVTPEETALRRRVLDEMAEEAVA